MTVQLLTPSNTIYRDSYSRGLEAFRDALGEETERDSVPLWQPNPDHDDGTPNPQRLAYESKADVIGYGGAAGGGKSDLALGLAATKHKRSVIFRRVFPNLREIIERSREIFNPVGVDRQGDSFNEQLHRWKLADGRMVEFESCQYEKDKRKQQGRPRDLYVFDEATEFSKSIIEFVTTWNRSTDSEQHCQIVLTFNPPTDSSGTWIIDYFMPWFAFLFPDVYHHNNPAEPGELRWYATVAGEEIERESGEPFEMNGEIVFPRSRTFIPARLDDNPHYGDDYRAVLQALREPLRSQMLYGNFGVTAKDAPWQVIPTSWVLLAQKRWRETDKPKNNTLSGVGVDAARGGADCMTVAKRYDNWFAEVEKRQGIAVDDGPKAAEFVRQSIGDEEPDYINIDVIGVGSSPYDSLKIMYENVNPVNVGEGSDYRDRSGKLKMRNKRAEMYWRMYEALDPENGDDIALPPGNEVIADLCAANYTPTVSGVQIEPKVDIKERIGRSPDVGEALMLANMCISLLSPASVNIHDLDINEVYKSHRKRLAR